MSQPYLIDRTKYGVPKNLPSSNIDGDALGESFTVFSKF